MAYDGAAHLVLTVHIDALPCVILLFIYCLGKKKRRVRVNPGTSALLFRLFSLCLAFKNFLFYVVTVQTVYLYLRRILHNLTKSSHKFLCAHCGLVA